MPSSSVPVYLICHLCGKKYGTASLPIHLPQCELKWRQQNGPNVPLPKVNYESAIGSASVKAADIQSMNEMANQTFLDQTRVPCQNCGRKFWPPERLEVHLRSCTSKVNNNSNPTNASNATVSMRPKTPVKTLVKAINKPIANQPIPKPSKVEQTSPANFSNFDEAGSKATIVLENFCETCGKAFSNSKGAMFCASCGTERVKRYV